MTREEALQAIKTKMDYYESDKRLRGALETLIPELRESEDERIRKELINFLRSPFIKENLTDEKVAPWLEWLEKQKEAGIQWLKSDNVKNPDKPYIDKTGMFYTTDGRMCYASEIEKQKEQKPDSLIYDKDLDKAAREFYLSGGADSPVDSTGLVPIVRMAEFGATWMKERMEKEQKPDVKDPFDDEQFRRGYDAGMADAYMEINEKAQEAHEKMEKIDFDSLDYDIKISTNDSSNPSGLKATNKSLDEINKETMAEQKSVEVKDPFSNANFVRGYESGYADAKREQKPVWSEEDEKMLARIIERGQSQIQMFETGLLPEHIAWLKSLRPSWKPSEDEERLINTSISFLKDFADKGYENAVECIDWLKSKLNGNTCK